MGGSLNLEILRGGGLKQFWKSRWMGGGGGGKNRAVRGGGGGGGGGVGGGSRNRAFRRGGVDFFCNNPIIFPFFLGQLWSLESFRWLFRPIRNSYTEF